MGYGSYSHDAHVALTSSRATGAVEAFRQSTCHPMMSPLGLGKRLSRDSDAHPNSLAIIFALDVSGSMGEIPRKLATETLPTFMKTLLDAGVADPQVMFMAIGHAVSDGAPLQVGQFESTAELMDQWLTWMFLEGGGAGGNESYELAMYVAARHTDIDCLRKRKHKGYLFITGDEPPNTAVVAAHVKNLLGEGLAADISLEEMIKETLESYEVFFLIPDGKRGSTIAPLWRPYLGDRVITMETPDDTGLVAAGLVSLVEGKSPNLHGLVARYRAAGVEPHRCEIVTRSLEGFARTIGRE